MELSSAILQVFATFVILILLLAGIGSVVRSSAGLRTQSTESLLMSVWLGYGVTLFSLQIWHLFFPVNLFAFCVFGLTGLSGLFWNRSDLKIWLLKIRTLNWVGLGLAGLWLGYSLLLADIALGPVRNVDTGSYHYSAVRWTASYAIVPGLANLNSRLGFNNSSLLFPALLDAGFWAHSAEHFSNGVLFVALAAQLASAAHRVITQKLTQSSDVFSIFVLGYSIQHSSLDATGFSTDMPVFALASVVTIQIIKSIADETEDARERMFNAASAIFLSAVAISAKISVSIYCGSAVLILLWKLRKQDLTQKTIIRTSLGASFLCVVVWAIRGVIVSGYPFFPITVAPMPVDWRVPQNTLVVHQHWITCWARRPGAHWTEVAHGWAWVSDWWNYLIKPQVWDFQIPLTICIVSALTIGFYFRKLSADARRSLLWCLLIPNILSILNWFLTAPSLRLGVGNFWFLSAICATLAAFVLNKCEHARLSKMLCFGGLYVALAAAGTADWIVAEPGPSSGFYPLPYVAFCRYKTDSGLLVLVPKDPGDPSTWDAPLPTAPYPQPLLALRRPGDLSSGFKVKPFDESIVIGMPP